MVFTFRDKIKQIARQSVAARAGRRSCPVLKNLSTMSCPRPSPELYTVCYDIVKYIIGIGYIRKAQRPAHSDDLAPVVSRVVKHLV